jgi:hypothetical protein
MPAVLYNAAGRSCALPSATHHYHYDAPTHQPPQCSA